MRERAAFSMGGGKSRNISQIQKRKIRVSLSQIPRGSSVYTRYNISSIYPPPLKKIKKNKMHPLSHWAPSQPRTTWRHHLCASVFLPSSFECTGARRIRRRRRPGLITPRTLMTRPTRRPRNSVTRTRTRCTLAQLRGSPWWPMLLLRGLEEGGGHANQTSLWGHPHCPSIPKRRTVRRGINKRR
jgi:hypothetical protein